MAYYWACVVLYFLHPRAAYHLMSLIENHAYEVRILKSQLPTQFTSMTIDLTLEMFHQTYSQYLECNADWLKGQPAPAIAKQYYESSDSYLFESFHTAVADTQAKRRCPQINNLYDTFVNIRDDEKEHASTMESLVQFGRLNPSPRE